MGKYLSDIQAKELICELGLRAYNRGFVSGSDGNITVKVADDQIWVTPTGVSKGFMTPSMLIRMDLNGNLLEKGELNPTSEIKMHLKLYQENADITSVIHAHPPYGTAFAIAGKTLDEALMAESVVYLGAVPVAKYACPGTQEVAESVGIFAKGYNACFLANHGTLTWGDDKACLDGYYRLESLEQSCKVNIIIHKFLDVISPLTVEQVNELYALRNSAGYKRGGELVVL